MKNWKRILSLMLVLALLLMLVACSNGSSTTTSSETSKETAQAEQPATEETKEAAEETEKKLHIGYAVMEYANSYNVMVANGVQARCDELGIELTIADGKMDANTQITAIENFIAAGVDAIICAPVDSASVQAMIPAIHEAGIVLISEGEEVPGRDAYIAIPEYDLGYAAGALTGSWMAENLTGPVEVAILDYPELKQVIDRANGLKDAILENYPEAEIVANQSALVPEEGMAAMEAILQAHPNVQIVAAINDGGALGAYEVMKAAGAEGDQYGVFGIDATDEAKAKILENGIYRGSIDSDPFGKGGLLVDTALRVIEEGPIDDFIPVELKPVLYKDLAG